MRGQGVIGGIALLTLRAGCGGGSGGDIGPGPGPPPFSSVPQVQVSVPTTFPSCSTAGQSGTLYSGTSLEPSLVVNPTNSSNLIAEWQEGRWSTGGAQALSLCGSAGRRMSLARG